VKLVTPRDDGVGIEGAPSFGPKIFFIALAIFV